MPNIKEGKKGTNLTASYKPAFCMIRAGSVDSEDFYCLFLEMLLGESTFLNGMSLHSPDQFCNVKNHFAILGISLFWG